MSLRNRSDTLEWRFNLNCACRLSAVLLTLLLQCARFCRSVYLLTNIDYPSSYMFRILISSSLWWMVNKMYLNYSLGSLEEIEGRGIPRSKKIWKCRSSRHPRSTCVLCCCRQSIYRRDGWKQLDLISFREALEAIWLNLKHIKPLWMHSRET